MTCKTVTVVHWNVYTRRDTGWYTVTIHIYSYASCKDFTYYKDNVWGDLIYKLCYVSGITWMLSLFLIHVKVTVSMNYVANWYVITFPSGKLKIAQAMQRSVYMIIMKALLYLYREAYQN